MMQIDPYPYSYITATKDLLTGPQESFLIEVAANGLFSLNNVHYRTLDALVEKLIIQSWNRERMGRTGQLTSLGMCFREGLLFFANELKAFLDGYEKKMFLMSEFPLYHRFAEKCENLMIEYETAYEKEGNQCSHVNFNGYRCNYTAFIKATNSTKYKYLCTQHHEINPHYNPGIYESIDFLNKPFSFDWDSLK